MTDKELLATASPCPFCRSAVLFFKDGAVACDSCQAEGPFNGHTFAIVGSDQQKREAVRQWNFRA